MAHRDPRIGFNTMCFSLLVCQHPETRKYLAVDEGNAGWWLPGGQVCRGETFLQTAYTKALQEAGMAVDVTGILAIEHSIQGPKGNEENARMRVIYFGHPKDSAAKPSSAEWKSVEELESTVRLRGQELLEWARFIEAGGQVAPLEMFQQEDHGPCRGLRKWNTPASSTAFLCPLTFMCHEAVTKRSMDDFQAILLRVPNLSAASLRNAMRARFAIQASDTDDVSVLAREYTTAIYRAATSSSSPPSLASDRALQRPDARIRTAFDTHGFSVVVCQHPESKKWLAVDESKNRGWWLPAGHVDRGQTFVEAAYRETEEEAGLRVQLTGLLAVERTLQGRESKEQDARMRVVFLATPADPAALPKSVPDSESNGAAWMTTAELHQLERLPPPRGLRGGELLHWGSYLEQGGTVFPASMFQEEQQGPSRARWEDLHARRQ